MECRLAEGGVAVIMRRPPKWTNAYRDRHGKVRFYLRVPGRPQIPLPGLPWSPEFMAAREAALKGEWAVPETRTKRVVAGTVSAALAHYYQSRAFTDELAPLTQQNRKAILEAFNAAHGDKRIALMGSEHLQAITSKKTPAAQRNFKKAMRGFVEHCLALGMLKTDPLDGLKLSKMKTKGHHTWEMHEVEQYRQRHTPGTRARLALELLLQTGTSRADAVRVGRFNVKDGTLSMKRQKTGVQFDIPLLPELVAELALHPMKLEQPTYLVTGAGNPFTAAGFGGWFRERCNEAGLKHCTAHGLRKCAAVMHALKGATAPQLMAWFAWRTIGEAQRYIEQADRIRLAKSAAAHFANGTVPNRQPRLGKTRRK